MIRRIGFPWSPAMVERSRRSAGATIAAARAALDDGAAVNLAGGTHHAFADRGEGYCVFNDVAVAARVLQREGRCTRIAVVDCDVHQGNGTAAIFRDDPTVFTFSMHGAKNYPFRKETSDLDVELPDGADDDEYLTALAAHLPGGVRPPAARPRVLPGRRRSVRGRSAGPTAGVDGRARGPRRPGLRRAAGRAGTPVAVAMSGGYAPDVDDIVAIHLQTVRGGGEPGADLAASHRGVSVPGSAARCRSASASSPNITSRRSFRQAISSPRWKPPWPGSRPARCSSRCGRCCRSGRRRRTSA